VSPDDTTLLYGVKGLLKDTMKKRIRKNGSWGWFGIDTIKFIGKNIGSDGIAVYNILCAHANRKTQSCYPSIATLAELTSLSENTVRKALRQLSEFKLISIQERFSDNGKQSSHLYTLIDDYQECGKNFDKPVIPTPSRPEPKPTLPIYIFIKKKSTSVGQTKSEDDFNKLGEDEKASWLDKAREHLVNIRTPIWSIIKPVIETTAIQLFIATSNQPLQT